MKELAARYEQHAAPGHTISVQGLGERMSSTLQAAPLAAETETSCSAADADESQHPPAASPNRQFHLKRFGSWRFTPPHEETPAAIRLALGLADESQLSPEDCGYHRCIDDCRACPAWHKHGQLAPCPLTDESSDTDGGVGAELMVCVHAHSVADADVLLRWPAVPVVLSETSNPWAKKLVLSGMSGEVL